MEVGQNAAATAVELVKERGAIIARLKPPDGAAFSDGACLAAFKDITAFAAKNRENGKKIRLVLNLGGLEYIQSTGVAGLIQLQNDLKTAGFELALAELSDSVGKIIAVMHLNNYFRIFAAEREALP